MLERRVQEYKLLREQRYNLLRELKKRGKTMESGVIELDEDDEGTLGDNRVSKRRGVRLTVY